MSINKNKISHWKTDIIRSVDCYNQWFLAFAPQTYRQTRLRTTIEVETALIKTNNLQDFSPEILAENHNILPILRMSTCPPIARDRLIGLSNVSTNLVNAIEAGKIPPRLIKENLSDGLNKICYTLKKLIDPDIFTWLEKKEIPSLEEIERAATIIADRLCGSVADPIIRNAQEKRQLQAIQNWLEERGYRKLSHGECKSLEEIPNGTFAFHFNVPILLIKNKYINLPVDVIIKPLNSISKFPVLIEAKSAGDYTNVNKRRKEEAIKMAQIRRTYGNKIKFILFLCGYFDSGYLGYEAAEGIDWVWEHRIDDLSKLGL